MPIKSARQFRFMRAAASDNLKKVGKSIGPSSEVAKEFINRTPKNKRSLFAKMK